MKKLFCAAGAACILAACIFSGCNLGDATVNFTLSEDGTHYVVSGVSGNRRALKVCNIPAEYSPEEGGQALPVTEIGYEAFFGCLSLYSVTLPDTVTAIGDRAFAQCMFSKFTIPESVQSIGYGAFGMCDALTEITVPQSVTQLSPLAFAYCTKLEKATVKADITVLRDRVFYNTAPTQGSDIYTDTSLTEIYLPASLQKIEVTYDKKYSRYVSAIDGNFITDIYFAGTEEQWNELYFYSTEKKEGTENEFKEKKWEKDTFLGPELKIHFNVEF